MIRQRARQACGPCRKRKVRCNGYYPCDVCEGYGYECDFPVTAPKEAKRAKTEESACDSNELLATVQEKPQVASRDHNNRSFIQREESLNQQSFVLVEVPNSKDLRLSSAPFPESLISRYTTLYSAAAFPRDIGQSLGLSDAPRLHPFAWHTGTRKETPPSLGNRLFEQVTLQDALKYAIPYFEILHPVFGFLVRPLFTRACIAGWSLRQMPVDIEATLCGVVALGSLFSSNSASLATETAVVEQARLLLDISVSAPPSQLSLKFVVAWLLRALYLRCTARPHLSWMASCNAMHIAESIGIHQEFGNMDVLHKRPCEVAIRESVLRRKTFWIAVSLNRLFSVEYGRTPVHLDSISCSSLESIEGDSDLTADFVNLCQLLPKTGHDPRKLSEEKEALEVNLQRLADPSTQHPPSHLLRAEICFSIFRKMRFLHLPMTESQTETVRDVICAGLLEAQSLSSTLSKWWSVISVPFHSVGVLIAMDTPASLAMLVDALETLQSVVLAYDTHLAREALQTAEQLIRGCHAKKMEGVSLVGHAIGVVNQNHDKSVPIEEQGIQPAPPISLGFDWPSENDSGWMEVFFETDCLFDLDPVTYE